MDLDRLQQQAQRYRDQAERQLAEIAQDRYLSPEGRRMKLAAAIKPCRDALEKLRASAVTDIARERAELERKLWADPGNNPVAWRDALDRASRIPDGDGQTAQALYQRAVRSGDTQLQKAIFLDNRWRRLTTEAGVPAEWEESLDSVARHVRELDSPMFKMNLSMLTSPPEPAELHGVSSVQLDQLAHAAG
jgi:hypothetical protein